MDYQTPLDGFHCRPWENAIPLHDQWTSSTAPWNSGLLDIPHMDDGCAMQRHYQKLDHSSGLPWITHQSVGTQALHNVSSAWRQDYEVDAHLDPKLRHYSSPCFSRSSSNYTSDSMSDRTSPPARSPHLTIVSCSPESAHREHLFFDSGIFHGDLGYNLQGGTSCVAMENVQRYADTLPDEAAFDDDQCYDYQPPQEGFIPIHSDMDENVSTPDEKPSLEFTFAAGQHHHHSTSPVIRRRRAPSHRATTSTRSPSRVNKRSSVRRSVDYSTKISGSSSNDATTMTGRAFPCPFAPYGCTSAFMAKNEWKRHVYTQHLRLGYWRCDQCSSDESRKPNDFNRKDLFVQHVRRMHPVAEKPIVTTTKRGRTARPTKNDSIDGELSKTADRCHRSLRSPPSNSCCFFCDQEFHGSDSFEERLEHIGKHMESAKKEGESLVDVGKWNPDDETETWLLEHGIVVQVGKALTLTDAGD